MPPSPSKRSMVLGVAVAAASALALFGIVAAVGSRHDLHMAHPAPIAPLKVASPKVSG
jgi:hypothetical protein